MAKKSTKAVRAIHPCTKLLRFQNQGADPDEPLWRTNILKARHASNDCASF